MVMLLQHLACINEFSGALFWINSRRNSLVTQPCSELHPNFRSGVEIGRQCNNDGNWSPVDISSCTMFIGSNPVLIIHFTAIINGSVTKDSTIIINNVSSSLNSPNLAYVYMVQVTHKIYMFLMCTHSHTEKHLCLGIHAHVLPCTYMQQHLLLTCAC